MNPVYAENFRRHSRIFLLPLLVSAIVAVWVVLGSGSTYRSTATLWVDTSVEGQSSLAQDNTVVRPPSAQLQLLLNELLTTRQFRLDVGKKGGLTAYLDEHPGNGWGPLAAISGLRGRPPLDERVISALSTRNVITRTTGPQIMAIDFEASNPKVAASTLRALVQSLIDQSTVLGADQRQRNLAYYQQQVEAAQGDLKDAQRDVAAFLNLHPNAAPTNTTLASLRHVETTAAAQLSAARAALSQTTNTVGATTGTTTLRYVDRPRVALAANGKHKQTLFALIAGLVVGAALSLLAVIGYTKFGEVSTRFRVPAEAEPVGPESEAVARPETPKTVEGTSAPAADASLAWEDFDPAPSWLTFEEVAARPAVVPLRPNVPAAEEKPPEPEREAMPLLHSVDVVEQPEELEHVGEQPAAEAEPEPEPEPESSPELEELEPAAEIERVEERSAEGEPEAATLPEREFEPAPVAELEADLFEQPAETEPESETIDAALAIAAGVVANGNGRPDVTGHDDFHAAAVRGTIVKVRDARRGRITRPVWTIQTDSPTNSELAEGIRFTVVGLPKREGIVRRLRPDSEGRLVFDYEITKLKLAARGMTGQFAVAPTDRAWVGEVIALAHAADAGASPLT